MNFSRVHLKTNQLLRFDQRANSVSVIKEPTHISACFRAHYYITCSRSWGNFLGKVFVLTPSKAKEVGGSNFGWRIVVVLYWCWHSYCFILVEMRETDSGLSTFTATVPLKQSIHGPHPILTESFQDIQTHSLLEKSQLILGVQSSKNDRIHSTQLICWDVEQCHTCSSLVRQNALKVCWVL